MSRHNSARPKATLPPAPNASHARVYSIGCYFTIQTLMRKLRLTPADCLQILADVLTDLDRQISEYESEGDGLPFPPM